MISAKKADFIVENKDDAKKQISLKFRFYDGNLFQYKGQEIDYQKVNFEVYEMPISGKNFEVGSVSKDSMLSSAELKKKIPLLRKRPRKILKTKRTIFAVWQKLKLNFLEGIIHQFNSSFLS